MRFRMMRWVTVLVACLLATSTVFADEQWDVYLALDEDEAQEASEAINVQDILGESEELEEELAVEEEEIERFEELAVEEEGIERFEELVLEDLDYEPPVLAEDLNQKREQKTYIAPAHPGSTGFYANPRKVTNQEYALFVEGTGYPYPEHWINGKIPKGSEHAPVVNVSYKDALIYAVWTRQRLPSAAEWMRASDEEGAFIDTDDTIDEWTTTPYVAARPDKQTPDFVLSRKRGGKRILLSPTRKSKVCLSTHERNGWTGFRCVSDD